MRIGTRLLAGVLLLTLYLPASVALAATETLSVTLQANETAGVVDSSLTVTALTDGSPDPSYTGTVTFSTTDLGAGVSLPGDYTFVSGDAGTKSFDVTLVTAGPQGVTATDTVDGTITGEGETTVGAAAAATIDMSGTDTSDLTSGSMKDIVALVSDAFGNPVIGQSVTFSQTLGSGSVSGTASVPTDNSGVATDTVTGVLAGGVTITGSTADAGTTTTSFVVNAGGAATLVLTGSTSNLASGSSRVLTATVKDAAGNGVVGETVDFTQSIGGGSVSGLTSPITNSLGVATDSVTGVLDGSVTVTATDGGLSDFRTFTIISGPAANLVVTQNTGSIASGATKGVTATVTDLASNPVSGASVVFTRTAGPGTVAGLTTVVTNGSGVATNTVTGVLAGAITITATDGSLNGALTFTITAGTAASLVVTQNTGSIASGATKAVTATVTDAAGNPVSGASVAFAKSAGTGTVTGTTTVSTDGSGVATDTVTGDLAGSITITATLGGLNGSLTFTITAGTAASLVVGGSTSNLASGATRAVTATVTDAAGNAVSGASVVFAKSAGTGTVTGTGTVPTNGSGVATDTVTGVLAGAITITATLGGLNGHLDFTITAGALNHITVTPSTSTITPGSQSYTTTAFDAAGNTTDVTGTAALSIVPNGSCLSTSCSAVAVGAHTVTSTYLTKTDTATLTIQNVAPTAVDDPFTVLENASSTAFNVLANDTDPNGDSLIVTAVSTPSHGTATVDAGGGGVHYHPTAHFNGSDSFNYSINDGNGGVDTGTVTVTITHVNEVPAFTKGANDTVLENSGARSVPSWATAISPGVDPTESGQTVTFIVSNDNNGLFSSQPQIDTSGNLTYTPGVNTNGFATVSVQAHDTGGTANGGVDTSAVQTFTITVTLVNQAPSFTKGADQTVFEDATPQAVPGWASAISSGPGDPFQSPTFTVTNDNNALFSSQPAVAANGALTFTTAADANGSSIVSVTLHDNGGTANSGQDTSPTQTFTITVTAVNDAPTFTKGPDISLPEESSPLTHTVPAWATGFIAGPPDESGQTILAYAVTNNNNGLFGVQPAINTSGNLTYRLAANRNGVATVSVTVQDSGGTANSGHDTSSVQTFTITVTGVDHPPAAVNDFPVVVQGSGPNSIDVLANDFDPDGDPITIIGLIQGTKGHAAIAADKKSVTYDPTGSVTGTDTFHYEISDGRGQVAFGSVQVSIVKDTFAPVTTAPRIWTLSTTSTTVMIHLKWTGTDQGYGVKYYQLQESRNGGAFGNVTVPIGASSVNRTVTNGSTYTYRVRGIDQIGNVGAWVLSDAFLPSAVPRPAPPTRHPPAAPLVQVVLGGSPGPSVSRRGTTGFVITP